MDRSAADEELLSARRWKKDSVADRQLTIRVTEDAIDDAGENLKGGGGGKKLSTATLRNGRVLSTQATVLDLLHCKGDYEPRGGPGSDISDSSSKVYGPPEVLATTGKFTVTCVRRGTDDCGGKSPPPASEPLLSPGWNAFSFSDPETQLTVHSIASIGMGSTDGKKMYIRRVPTTASEILSIVNPPTPVDDDSASDSSYSSSVVGGQGGYRLPRRQHWTNKAQFVLACIGYSVGLGNVWRFPYLCYRSGGGVFLVPYFIILVVCGIPLLYMELAVGQYTRRGPIGALGKLCPLFKGAGMASVVISFLMSTYYNVIIAWALYYFFTSFKTELPWKDCGNRWNTENCWHPTGTKVSPASSQDVHKVPLNPTSISEMASNGNISSTLMTVLNESRSPIQEFYDRKVLQLSEGIDYPGAMRWELVACLFVAWILVYFSLWKSVKSSGKVVYFTATFPYILIVVFLTRALTLEGAELGLNYFFKPKWELLANANVWVNAAAQNFNSIGIAFGSVISFASYNRFHNEILVDTLAISSINAVTSLLVGMFAFATIGNIATEQGSTVEAVITDGPGLVFVVYPQALAKMPVTQVWAVFFFFMLLCLGLDSQFAIVEVVVTSIKDGFPNWIKRNLKCHEVVVLVVCIVSFLFGLPNLTQGGIYFFQLIDHYAASISIMYLAFFEVIAISWFYGADRLCQNVLEMTGRMPSFFFRFCWWIAAPVLIMAVWVFSLIDYYPPTYNNKKYVYPRWAEGLGWGMSSLSLACIPLLAAVVLLRAEGNTLWEKIRHSLKSQIPQCSVCGHGSACNHQEKNGYAREEISELPMLIKHVDAYPVNILKSDNHD
ncbi:sodium- and chloride-dependent GABA transporter ine isoform X1 [Ischnura elegans]|uniref:sodium- and chloride-dependent GABA transporter ine isoform X1 n=1 Tax=Ischnura elegans TaxID=197161 RepID=UPI001ED89AB1|nr:sodium- and chloride-dependent GABA transporter ine isoform X1 [Ischnura elegans]